MHLPRKSSAKIVLNQKKEDSVVAQPRAASVSVTLAITQKDAECVTKHFAIPIIFSHATTTSAWIEFVAKNVASPRKMTFPIMNRLPAVMNVALSNVCNARKAHSVLLVAAGQTTISGEIRIGRL